jgi:hypothetical protein
VERLSLALAIVLGLAMILSFVACATDFVYEDKTISKAQEEFLKSINRAHYVYRLPSGPGAVLPKNQAIEVTLDILGDLVTEKWISNNGNFIAHYWRIEGKILRCYNSNNNPPVPNGPFIENWAGIISDDGSSITLYLIGLYHPYEMEVWFFKRER